MCSILPKGQFDLCGFDMDDLMFQMDDCHAGCHHSIAVSIIYTLHVYTMVDSVNIEIYMM